MLPLFVFWRHCRTRMQTCKQVIVSPSRAFKCLQESVVYICSHTTSQKRGNGSENVWERSTNNAAIYICVMTNTVCVDQSIITHSYKRVESLVRRGENWRNQIPKEGLLYKQTLFLIKFWPVKFVELLHLFPMFRKYGLYNVKYFHLFKN